MEEPKRVNNPLRVPPILEALDGPQAGRQRVISVIGQRGMLRVGVPYPEEPRTMQNPDEMFYTVEKTEDRMSKDESRVVRLVAGSRIPITEAADLGLVDVQPAILLARPESERPDVAPTELENLMVASPRARTQRRPALNAPVDSSTGGGEDK